MRTLWLAGSRPESPCPEACGPESQRPDGNTDLETGYDCSQAQDANGLPLLPHRDPRRATDADAGLAGCRIHGGQTTGEPCALKVCAAERGVESLAQSGGARRDAPGSSD